LLNVLSVRFRHGGEGCTHGCEEEELHPRGTGGALLIWSSIPGAPKEATHDVSRVVDLLGVSRSGYYASAARHAHAQSGPRAARRDDLNWRWSQERIGNRNGGAQIVPCRTPCETVPVTRARMPNFPPVVAADRSSYGCADLLHGCRVCRL